MNIYLVIYLSLLLAGFSGGYEFRSVQCREEQQAQVDKAIKAYETNRTETQKIEDKVEQKDVEIKYVDKYITKEIVKYVPKIQTVHGDCDVSVDVIRLLNQSINSSLHESTSKPDGESRPTSGATGPSTVDRS